MCTLTFGFVGQCFDVNTNLLMKSENVILEYRYPELILFLLKQKI